MQDLFGSVRRSIVFRTTAESTTDAQTANSPTPFSGGNLVERFNSCIRNSRVLSKHISPSVKMSPPIRWRKGELIGCGAFGRVYMGMNLDSGELLAVKQVLIAANFASKEKAQDHIKELEEEVKLLKDLSHPNIVRYLGTVREEESLNILLEFVPGGSISSLLGKFGPFPEAVMRTYTKQLLLGLEYLHNHGIMHRDIKGANILVDNKGCIKLADFGASKQVAELATISGAKSMKGTPYWMAPEVIRQTGHSYSADIWSVGCTVIEMATGKPPWSQQYQEVAALFHIGTTKSHPPIPENLSVKAKDFLLKCLEKEPDLRPTASELLKHPFVTGDDEDPVLHASVMKSSEILSPSHVANLESLQMLTSPGSPGSADICNLDSLSCSRVIAEKLSGSMHGWVTSNSNDDMCQLDQEDFVAGDRKLSSILAPNDLEKSRNPMCEPSDDWRWKFDGSPEPEKNELKPDSDESLKVPASRINASGEEDNGFSFPRGTPLSEDDDELTESKIKAFLDAKALELKKLQTPLYEEFYNSLNSACSPSFVESVCDETSPNYLKLPPKSRSPSRAPVGTSPVAVDAVGTGSPGSNGKRASNIGVASNISAQENSSPQPESCSPSMSFSERQRKWKEELRQELEREREMMRQAGVGGKSSSPKDRVVNRQRDRTRFASPGK
ncbi:mitogen-activated protein kinase kinase kinase 2 [Citrus sinensis]|uniref:mitogen-activated protein kinase kinase kinase NPK1 isoform X2 n=1 Tax=Citrus sinensis TaxID=2711 RepID=UPI00219A3122|nr:mitogen-activated protein kinase kinase kinase NPK1 isoform X2 [Citrus sinensis]KAH9689223.1 mitogen-activated protein kinase kinase kinase 2 [Citrus sinensis]